MLFCTPRAVECPALRQVWESLDADMREWPEELRLYGGFAEVCAGAGGEHIACYPTPTSSSGLRTGPCWAAPAS